MLERTDLLIRSVVLVREGVDPLMMINHCPDTKKQRQK